VKPYRERDGKPALWFNDGEIDHWMEVELHRTGLYPTERDPVVKIEAFVDRHLRADLDTYAPLPPTVLGQTQFRPGSRPKILINGQLTTLVFDQPGAPAGLRSKWRMTVAHEASHVLLHQRLFHLDDRQTLLFPTDHDPDEELQCYRCLEHHLEGRVPGHDPREVQANRGMAALLMPKTFFLAQYAAELDALGRLDTGLDRDSLEVARVAQRIAAQLDVSIQSVRIRFEELNVLRTRDQIRLI
jgi:hypothetical protein